MKKIILLIASLLLFISFTDAQGVKKESFIYSVKGSDTLRLDKYDTAGDCARPCMIFMFGGGFVNGTRDAEYYQSYFDYFANQGFVVVSIDYRLGFKPLADGTLSTDGMKSGDFLGLFEKTINMAVEDLFDATNFVLQSAEKWNVDPKLIISSGSSAGAVAVLQGEYQRANRSFAAGRLPEDFRYAGVISFAGAVYSSSGKLKWESTPAPLLMFHGDADMNVPYGKKKIFKYGFYGSQHLAKRYAKQGFPYWFNREVYANHKISVSPMTENLEEMMSFIRKYILEGQNLQTEVSVISSKRPKVKQRFGIKDYVRANFAPRE